MRGLLFTTNNALPAQDLDDLADDLAERVYRSFGSQAYRLRQRKIHEIVEPYIHDVNDVDQRLVAVMVWDLLQEGAQIELGV